MSDARGDRADRGRPAAARRSILTLGSDGAGEPAAPADLPDRSEILARRWRRAGLLGSFTAWMLLAFIARGDQVTYSIIAGLCLSSLGLVPLAARIRGRTGRMLGYEPGARTAALYRGYLRGTVAAFCALVVVGLIVGWWPRPSCPDCGPDTGA